MIMKELVLNTKRRAANSSLPSEQEAGGYLASTISHSSEFGHLSGLS